MWIADTPKGYYRHSADPQTQVKYLARRLWLLYVLRLDPDHVRPEKQLAHVRALMRTWDITWTQVTDEAVLLGYDEAVRWVVERALTR